MTCFYLLNQEMSGIKKQIIFDDRYQPIALISGYFGLGRNQINIFTMTGRPIGNVHQVKSNISNVYQLENQHTIIGQMTKLTGVWHQFAFVSSLNWTVIGSITTNSYQVSHGIRTVFTTESIVTSKQLDGIKITLQDRADQTSAFLVAATLNQWVLLSQHKTWHLFNPLLNTAPN